MTRTTPPTRPRYFLIQRPMLRVCEALAPIAIFSIYLFGWRALLLLLVVTVFGVATEAIFLLPKKKPVTSAVFVTCLIFTLSLPPAVPFWIAAIGIIVGVGLGKMVFGGFGRNIFNPAMVGRCFIYVCFPVQLTSGWLVPFASGWRGFGGYSPGAGAITSATPLVALKQGMAVPFHKLFFGFTSGCLGETCGLLIIAGGIYILWRKAASWKLTLSCLAGGLLFSLILDAPTLGLSVSLLRTLFAGAFLFGSVFVVTEPVTAPNTEIGKWVYGAAIGALAVTLRAYSNFPEGVMFAVLILNAFVPLMDKGFKGLQMRKRNR